MLIVPPISHISHYVIFPLEMQLEKEEEVWAIKKKVESFTLLHKQNWI